MWVGKIAHLRQARRNVHNSRLPGTMITQNHLKYVKLKFMKSNKGVGLDFFVFEFFKKVHVGGQCCPPPTRIGLSQKIIQNSQDFGVVLNGIGSKTLNVMPSISQTFEIQSITECFQGVCDIFVLIDIEQLFILISEAASHPFL